MTSRGLDSSVKDTENDMLPTTSPTLHRPDAVILADELPKAADMINWPRMPELKESEKTAGHIAVARYCGAEEPMDTSAPERPQLRKSVAWRKPGWALLLRKMLDAKAPPTETGLEEAFPFKRGRYFCDCRS